MPHAVIQGEIHTSRKDKSRLQERLSSVGAVMREGTDTQWNGYWDPMYLLLFLGMKFYHGTIQRFLYVSHQPVFDAAEDLDIDTHKLDISIREWADQISTVKELFLIVLAAAATYGTVMDIANPLIRISATPPLFIFLFFLFTAVLTIRERDGLMVDKINDIMAEQEYGQVLISVGDGHVQGIRNRLVEQGWDIDTHESRNILARLLRPYMDVVRRI